MAKRTTPRSHANDTSAEAPVRSTDAPARPATRRTKSATPPTASPDTLGVFTGIEATERRGTQPSEEAIRVRAYQRYLERGGTGGNDFQDWLEAERELKSLMLEV
jgi:hypothetical protein